jgi:hypothetical protein
MYYGSPMNHHRELRYNAVGSVKEMVGSVAGLGCSTFGRSAGNGGSVDRTHKSKCYKDIFREEHDVEIKASRKESRRID